MNNLLITYRDTMLINGFLRKENTQLIPLVLYNIIAKHFSIKVRRKEEKVSMRGRIHKDRIGIEDKNGELTTYLPKDGGTIASIVEYPSNNHMSDLIFALTDNGSLYYVKQGDEILIPIIRPPSNLKFIDITPLYVVRFING